MPWSSAEKTLDPVVRRQDSEIFSSGMKTAQLEAEGFLLLSLRCIRECLEPES
jgi:hypothetical protein